MSDSNEEIQPSNEPDWYTKNSAWAIPLGILTGIVLCSGCFTIFYYGAINTIKKGPAYAAAVKLMNESDEVKEHLGEPIETGIPGDDADIKMKTKEDETGRERYTGYAKFTIPVTGPKREGRLYVEADVIKDAWTLKKVILETDDEEEEPGKTIRLLNTNPAAAPIEK